VDIDPAGIYAATCSFDKWIRLFDFYSGRCLARVSGHSELVTGVRFTQDGRRLISIGGDGW
jgi:mitogen-activated protein kinase binding protein 1